MAVSIAPETECMIAIRDRINAGDTYAIPFRAVYSDIAVDRLEESNDLKVDVTIEESEQLNETLAIEDRTSHLVRIWIRKKLRSQNPCDVDPVRLIARQIFQQVNNWDSSDGRVTVWEAEFEPKQIPDKETLRQSSVFLSSIVLRVEVEPS